MLHAFGRTESRIMNTSFIKNASYYNNEYESACKPHDCVCACGRVSVCVCARACADMYARMCQHVGESMQYVYASSTWQGGAPIPFSSILLQLPMTTSYSLGASHRILERRDFPTHRDSAGRVHLRPLPPKWADGHWLQWEGHPTSHSYWMRLPKVSLLAWQVYLEGLTLASAVYIIKKRLARGCQVKLPACRPVRRGCFSAPVLFSTITQPFGWKEFFNSVSDAFQHRVFQHSETWRSWSARGWTVPERFLTRQILRRPHLTIIEYYIKLDPTWIHVM